MHARNSVRIAFAHSRVRCNLTVIIPCHADDVTTIAYFVASRKQTEALSCADNLLCLMIVHIVPTNIIIMAWDIMIIQGRSRIPPALACHRHSALLELLETTKGHQLQVPACMPISKDMKAKAASVLQEMSSLNDCHHIERQMFAYIYMCT